MEIRCSSLSRVMSCAGSLHFKDLPKQEAGFPAQEGTAAGEYLEHLLLGKPLFNVASNGIAIDDDIRYYMKEVHSEILSQATGPITCERRIDWKTSHNILIRGSYDICYVKDGMLCVDDLKYGYGLVEVKENWQLLGYAIGFILNNSATFYPKIRLRILQPRPHHEDGPIRTWELTFDELCEYKNKIDARFDLIGQGYSALTTGKWCKYCPAAATACPAFNRALYAGVEFALNDFSQDSITEKELAAQLDLMERVSEIFKIKYDSIKQLAISKIREGKIVPGYMNEISQGDRRWKDGVDPEVFKILTGLDVLEKTMITPAKAVRLGVPKDLVDSIVERKNLGSKLVKRSSSKDAKSIFETKEK